MASITPGRNSPSSSHPAAPRPHSERRWRPQHPWGHAPSAVSPMMPPPQHVVGVRPSAAEPAVEGVRSAQAKRSPVSSAEARAGGRGGFPGLRFSSDNDGDPDGHPCLPRQQRRRLPAGQQPGVLGRDAPPSSAAPWAAQQGPGCPAVRVWDPSLFRASDGRSRWCPRWAGQEEAPRERRPQDAGGVVGFPDTPTRRHAPGAPHAGARPRDLRAGIPHPGRQGGAFRRRRVCSRQLPPRATRPSHEDSGPASASASVTSSPTTSAKPYFQKRSPGEIPSGREF